MSEIIVNKLIKMEEYISELEGFKPETYKEYKMISLNVMQLNV